VGQVKYVIKKMVPDAWMKKAREWWYHGTRVWCPCCEKSFRKFRSYRGRENAACPYCNSYERHRHLWLFIKNKTNLLAENLRVFHVAPEEFISRALRSFPNLDYLSVDLRSPLAMERIDITQIPYPDNSFDVILCNHVLEHIPDDAKAIGELCRILKDDGWAIIQAPVDPSREVTYEDFAINSDEGRKNAFGQEDHVRIYGKDYGARLEKGGFSVTIERYADELGSEKRKKYGIMPDHRIYLCRKARRAL
jgi:SAM-dependent methyltransferase